MLAVYRQGGAPTGAPPEEPVVSLV
jgi:hypothetical protein